MKCKENRLGGSGVEIGKFSPDFRRMDVFLVI